MTDLLVSLITGVALPGLLVLCIALRDWYQETRHHHDHHGPHPV